MAKMVSAELGEFEVKFKEFLVAGQVPEGMHNGLWGMLLQMLEGAQMIRE